MCWSEGVLAAGWRGFESEVLGSPQGRLQLGTSVRRKCLWVGEGQVISVAP